MSDVDVAGRLDAVGEIPEDYAEFERLMQPARTPAKEETAQEADAGDGETDATKSADGDKAPSEDKTTEQEGEGDDDEAEKPQKKGGWKRRTEKAEQRAAEAERRAAELEAQLAGGKTATGEKPTGDKTATDGEVKTFSGKPKPQSKDFDDYDSYTEALTDWTLDEKQAKREHNAKQQQAAEARQTKAEQFLERSKALREKYADFDEVTDSDIKVSPAVGDCMLDSEHGPEIGYYLAKNPAEAERINKLSPLAAAREIGKLETKFATAPKPKPVTSAPDPLPKPLSSGGRAIARRFDDPSVDYATFEKQMNARRR